MDWESFAEAVGWFLSGALSLCFLLALLHAARNGSWGWVVGCLLFPPVMLFYPIEIVRTRRTEKRKQASERRKAVRDRKLREEVAALRKRVAGRQVAGS